MHFLTHHLQVFGRYTALVEGSIQRRLEASLLGFDMVGFMAMLDERKVGGWLGLSRRCQGGDE